ncbi:hypothetical protein TWF694_007597 [Orbilia ellipsospora]|uniref:Uncharacterized protein n=2 Tax=Orbilia ellipsospora TaxID=2528407 RepID=A0AAV9XIN2_9PEZI
MPTPDPLSFTAPSHIKVLLAPVGRIKRAKFYEFVERLQAGNKVRLENVGLDSRGTKTTFSPLSFPSGQIVYNLTTSYNTEHEYLDGLEMHRRTYMVIAIADYMEKNSVADLRAGIQDLNFQYPKALLFPLVLFDTPIGDDLFSRDTHRWAEDGELSSNVHEYPRLTIPIPSKDRSSVTSIRGVMSDLSSLLLYEFESLSKSLQALHTIEAPILHEEEKSPTKFVTRMSMPVGLSGPTAAQFANLGAVGTRLSMTGFGSGSVTERERVKGKGRISIAIANLHLMAGFVTDAFREFTEGAIAAKNNSDYLWHGKALEGIGVSLVIMAHMGLDLQIPTVVFPATTPLSETKWKLNGAVNETLESVFAMMPELLNTILGLYNRAGTFNQEYAPALVQSETIIRFCKLMVVCHQCHGLNEISLPHLVLGAPLPTDLGRPSLKNLSRVDIATRVMQAYPFNLQSLTVVDAASILGGMAAVLDKIGFKRKKALITRELLKLLVPSLIQARVVGAAETGLHPTASGGEEFRPASRNSSRPGTPQPRGGLGGEEHEGGLDGDEADIVRTSRLLDDLCSAYGITHNTLSSALDTSTDEEKNTLLRKNLADSNYCKGFGWLSLKVGVLRSCILLTEAIPDYEAILRYTTKLLEIAGTDLSKGEQGKLAESFTRTVGLARKSGLDEELGGVADYWDDFLLRDVELVESQIWKPPVPRAAAELTAATGAAKNPFIYNPFASKHTTVTSLADTAVKTLLVESEPVEFLITLQNPFDFEIQIDNVALEVTGVKFETLPASLVIGPYRQHTYIITGIPQSSGAMKLLGAKIRVYGCKERFFAIIPDVRMVPVDGEDKIKQVGLGVMSSENPRPISHISTTSAGNRMSLIPQPSCGPDLKQLSINVIPAQPKLIITHTSLPQNAIMVLEGEKQVFTVHVKNESTSVAVDFVAISFIDSTTEPVTNAIAQKQGLPAEIYELEVILYKKKAFEWVQPDEDVRIPPGGRGVFQVQVLGKPGLVSGKIVVDYGFIDREGEAQRAEAGESTGRWYTRRTETDVTVTVNAAVELVRMDFLPWSGVSSSLLASQHNFEDAEGEPVLQNGDTNGKVVESVKLAKKNEQVRELFSRLTNVPNPSTYALVLIDIRNSWPHPLKVSMFYNPSPEDIDDGFTHEKGEDDMKFTASDTIPAGHSTRLILPLKRIYVANPTAPIPSLNKTQRQYVVSMTKVSPEIERVTREGFWYKEAVLGRVSGSWEEVGSDRQGVVECRNFRMSGSRGVDVVKAEEVDVSVTLENDVGDEAMVRSIARGRWGVKTDEFFKVKVVVKNRGQKKVRLISRLLPCLRFVGGGNSGNAGLEMTRRIGVNGTLQKSLGWLRSGEEMVVELGIVVIASGEYEILGCVEEVKGDEYDEEDEDEGKKTNGESAPLEVEQRLLEDMIRGERKVWYAREVCNVVASD